MLPQQRQNGLLRVAVSAQNPEGGHEDFRLADREQTFLQNLSFVIQMWEDYCSAGKRDDHRELMHAEEVL